MSESMTVNQTGYLALLENNSYLPKKKNLIALQVKQLDAFLQRGFPTRQEELWKYSDTSFLKKQNFTWASKTKITHQRKKLSGIRLVFVNGYLSSELSDLSLLPKGVTLCSLAEKTATTNGTLPTEFDAKRYPFAALNTALMTDGFYLSIPDNCVVDETIHCLFLSSKQNNFLVCPRNVIVAGANSQITLIEEYANKGAENYFTNTVTEIFAENNATLFYYKIQDESLTATHIANMFVSQKKDSVIKSFCIDRGSCFTRENIAVDLLASGAECYLHGFYKLTQDKQHIDNHILVNHLSQHGTSHMLYKGTLDKKSHAVFNGKVFVHKDAQKTIAMQGNHNLLLSGDSEIDTKPELEIYADDVKCAHGATVGQLDAESLFYLRARGIDKIQAKLLLTQAFADDVLEVISHSDIKDYIQQIAGHYAE